MIEAALVSCDDHLDLNMLPADLWQGRMAAKWGERTPRVVEELDYRHWRLMECQDFWADKGGIPHKMKPSEVFKRQVYGTFQQSPTAMRLTEFWGPENLLWASDYPHPDSIWPHSVKTIGETMGRMDPEEVLRIVGGNAARLYGLDLSQATVRAKLPIGYEAVAAE